MKKAIETAQARRSRRVPKELEVLYWALPAGWRQRCLKDAQWYAECERRRREEQADLAAGKWRKVSFSVAPEQYRMLKLVAEANDTGRSSPMPGHIAKGLFVWAAPALQGLLSSGPQCAYGSVSFELHKRFGGLLATERNLSVVPPTAASAPATAGQSRPAAAKVLRPKVVKPGGAA